MFLPVLLVRDYGVWGFVVFAVPNVVGAGAMGWVLREGAAERIVERHRAACAAFSVMTAAFQVFFAGWFLFRLDRTGGYNAQYPLVLGLVGATIAFVAVAWALFKHVPRLGRVGLSALALSVSVCAGYSLLRLGALDRWHDGQWQALMGRREAGLVWMTPVCLFGFALCPYLDLTFLRTRYSQSLGGARASFGFGFGVLFAGMILMTLAYAPLALGLMGYPLYRTAAAALVVALAAHLFVQLATTITFHVDELRRLPREMGRVSLALLLTWLVLVGVACFKIDWQVVARLQMLDGEIVYRCFMSFYGLLFPAYVWLCMIPGRDGHSGIGGAMGRRKLMVLVGACVLAAPCYWMGFVERVEWWLAPGLGVVLVARLFARGDRHSAMGSRR